jgi:NADP-dependent 3-hydroxy acid dehydrogenase YdfG
MHYCKTKFVLLSLIHRDPDCNQASLSGISGIITAPLYCATKHAIVGFVKSLKDSEPLTGVKITTLCPGAVMTPLLDAQKITQYSVAKERSLTPEACAEKLLDLLQKKEYPCGTVLEITMNGDRVIPEWNVSPPDGQGTGRDLVGEQMIENLMAPISRALEKDKKG